MGLTPVSLNGCLRVGCEPGLGARLFFENSTVCQVVDAEMVHRLWVLPRLGWGSWVVGLGVDARMPARLRGLVVLFFDAELMAPLGVSLLCRFPCRFGGGGPVDIDGEFDSGSGRTLAACLTHASGATNRASARGKAANG